MNNHIKRITAPVFISVLMCGCATAPKEIKTPPNGEVKVEITDNLPPPGGHIGNFSDVRVVTSSKAIKGNAFSMLTAVPSALLGGDGSLYREKTEMYGEPLESADKKRIKNPLDYNADFVSSIQKSVDDFLSASPEYRAKKYKNKLYITTGMARLLYESLTGPDSEKYRLHVTMYAHKKIEHSPSLRDLPSEALVALSGNAKPNVVIVKCNDASKQFYSIDQWLASEGSLLKEELDSMSKACHGKITGELPNLLSR